MTVSVRPYDRQRDCDRVGDFLVNTYVDGGRYPNWLQARWEYMHFHPALRGEDLPRIGLWEDDGAIVAVANFEHRLGVVYFQVHPDYGRLKPEMLAYAEENLSETLDDGDCRVRVFINDFDLEFTQAAQARGYRQATDWEEWITLWSIPSPFPAIELPPGFRLQSLADENDLRKVHRVLHRGFDHPGEPDDDLDCRRLMQSAPNFRPDLTIVAVAPAGDYVSFCGTWYDPVHRIAYVEPVATDPAYRRMGLGLAAVRESVRRCGVLGATVAVVESGMEFYRSMGFRKTYCRHSWTKTWG